MSEHQSECPVRFGGRTCRCKKRDRDYGALAELQLEAIRGVLEEVLTTSGSPHPEVWGPWLLGELSRILDMTALEVMEVLAGQEERRAL